MPILWEEAIDLHCDAVLLRRTAAELHELARQNEQRVVGIMLEARGARTVEEFKAAVDRVLVAAGVAPMTDEERSRF